MPRRSPGKGKFDSIAGGYKDAPPSTDPLAPNLPPQTLVKMVKTDLIVP